MRSFAAIYLYCFLLSLVASSYLFTTFFFHSSWRTDGQQRRKSPDLTVAEQKDEDDLSGYNNNSIHVLRERNKSPSATPTALAKQSGTVLQHSVERGISGYNSSSLDIFRSIPDYETPLSPDIDSFRKIFRVNHTILGERNLYSDPEFGVHFLRAPSFDTPEFRGRQLPGVARFRDSFIAGDIPLVFTGGGKLVYYPTGCKAAQTAGHNNTLIPDPEMSSEKEYNVVEIDVAVMIGQLWGNAYYHSIIENLPRLAYVSDFLANPLNNATVLAFPRSLISKDRVEKIWNPHIVRGTPKWLPYAPRNTIYFVRHLLIPTGTGCGNAQPEPLRWARERLASFVQQKQQEEVSDEESNKPLILLQKRSKKRGLHNHDELLHALHSHFADSCHVLVHDDDMPMKDYALLYSRATILIGPHGAGFANLIFTTQGLRGMLELHAEQPAPRLCHQATAAALHIPVVSYQRATDNSTFGEPFRANVSYVVEWVRDVLLLPSTTTTTTTNTSNGERTAS